MRDTQAGEVAQLQFELQFTYIHHGPRKYTPGADVHR
jgi:hypothetical protein